MCHVVTSCHKLFRRGTNQLSDIYFVISAHFYVRIAVRRNSILLLMYRFHKARASSHAVTPCTFLARALKIYEKKLGPRISFMSCLTKFIVLEARSISFLSYFDNLDHDVFLGAGAYFRECLHSIPR